MYSSIVEERKVFLNIREIRKATGLNRTAFARKYGIPMRTVENWEKEFREPPDYVLSLLERAVREDCKIDN